MSDYDAARDSREGYEVGIAEIRRRKIAAGEIVPWVREEIIGDCRLLLGDCMEILPTLPNVDVVITDPPYSISLPGSSGSFTRINRKGTRSLSFFAGDTDWPAMTASVVERVMAAAALSPLSLYCWCGHRQFGPLTEALELAGYSTRFIVWKKTCPAPAPPRSGWQSGVELCIYAYKSGRFFADVQINNVIESDSFRFGQPGKVDHPTQKPLATIAPLITTSARPADTILDPFLGSGTTMVACAKLGRRGIGIEIDPGYFDIACRRVEEAYRSPDLFIEHAKREAAQTVDLFAESTP